MLLLPGSEVWSPEAGHSPLSPSPEGLLHQLGLTPGVYPPEASLPRLLLRPRDLHEVAVEAEVVADRVLEHFS